MCGIVGYVGCGDVVSVLLRVSRLGLCEVYSKNYNQSVG